jgi:RNA polymerase sigma-70 factor (ECF subfamily)
VRARLPRLAGDLHNGACEQAKARRAGPPVIHVRLRGRSRPSSALARAPGDVTDDASLAELARVDAEAFGVLYDRYCDQIFRFVYYRLNEREAAEDVTAEVFFKALRAIDSYRPSVAAFSTWLHRIAANALIDYVRVRRVTLSIDAAMDVTDRAPPVDEQVISRVEAARMWEVIDSLTEAQRTAVALRYGRDLPITAIAERMGRSEGAVKLLLNRGLAAVRHQVQSAAGGREGQP